MISSDLAAFKAYLENNLLISIFPPPADTIKSKCRKPRKLALQNVQQTSLNAKPLNGINENIVSLADGRTQILTTAQWPYSVHGVIAMKFGETTSWGSGTLIGPNIVITAAHNLYHFESKVFADLESLQYLPAVNGQILPFEVIKVEEYFVSPDYISKQKEDYGILILKKPIGEITGYFGLACLDPSDLSKKIINITGYPADKVASKPKTYELWGMEGAVSRIEQDQGELYYLIDTAGGQSGSGVFYQENGEYFVCGVHVRGGQTANQGTLITKKGYEHIYNWVQKYQIKSSLCLKNSHRLEFQSDNIDKDCMELLFEYDLDDIRSLILGWKKFQLRESASLLKMLHGPSFKN